MGHRPQDYIVPFFPLVTIREGFSFGRDLGYVYDYLESPEIPNAAAGEKNRGKLLSSLLLASFLCCWLLVY